MGGFLLSPTVKLDATQQSNHGGFDCCGDAHCPVYHTLLLVRDECTKSLTKSIAFAVQKSVTRAVVTGHGNGTTQ